MKKGKKLNNEIFSIRDTKTAEGVFMGLFPILDSDVNQVTSKRFDTPLFFVTVKNKAGEEMRYWADGGLRGTLKMARVEPGQPIFIEHTGSKEIEEGVVQTYDIYGAE